jgi:hypothetical protein
MVDPMLTDGPDLSAMADALGKSPDYRVLRRLIPRTGAASIIFLNESSVVTANVRVFVCGIVQTKYRKGSDRASILIAVIGIAVLMAQNPVALFAQVTASLVDRFGIQPATDRPTPTIESSPILRLCRRSQRTHQFATKLMPLSPPIRIRRKIARRNLKPCLGNSKLGQPTRMRRSSRKSLSKMPQRFCKVPPHVWRTRADTSGLSSVPRRERRQYEILHGFGG